MPAVGDFAFTAQFAVTVVASRPECGEMVGKRDFSACELAAQIRSLRSEQAGIKTPVRRNPGPMAVAAEGFADRADEADLARAVVETVTGGHFAAIVGIERNDRPLRRDTVAQFGRSHHLRALPAVAGAHVHVFDETQHMPTAAEVFHQRQHLIFVDAALDHAIDLQRMEACLRCRADAFHHRRHFAASAGHFTEQIGVQGVQADRQPAQARLVQGSGLCGEQRTIGGQRQVVDARNAGKPRDQLRQALSQQRLAAGQAQLVDADTRESAHQDFYFVERQARRRIQAVVVRHLIGGHAVTASEIAGLDHRQTQVAQRPAASIQGHARRRARRPGRGLRNCTHVQGIRAAVVSCKATTSPFLATR